MKVFKKALALLLAALFLVSAAGCSAGDVSYVVKSDDGTQVLPGMYVGYLLDAYMEALSLVEDNSKSPLGQTIDGTEGGAWINNRALQNAKRYLSILKKFDELGLDFDTAAQNSAKTLADSIWNTYGSLYEENGCSYNSLLLVAQCTAKSNLVFEKLYGKGGEKEIAESDIKTQFEKDYVEVRGLVVSLTDSSGAALAEDERQVYIDKLGECAARIQNGEDYDTVSKEYQKWYAEKKEYTFDESSYDSAAQYTLLNKSSSSLPTSMVDDIFAAKVGDVKITSDASMAMVYVKNDVNRDPKQLDSVRLNVMKTLKIDEYQTLTSTWAEGMNLTVNENAVGYYTAQKIH